ncbi:maleylpyruvate isomerase family mycothiol-dependent enzyme [Kutzneria buriramensis]|uniref:Maleylpyruvate isomerase n=1 Tax=Kutzneria buriramensis TaxID=1045776 RepID=A0A3E0HE40_9PSEU|nr:maleylpyruvate isomerase family mycothiol-dependent enzyme [Kutzneria buriramensis]REH43534.1 maleylpyruvate isomerase [Kutzneria buriramensis]
MKSREWTDVGTKLFLATLDGLADAELDAPSLLPGWSRRHVVAHVHHNAEALRRLVSWAETGVENRMYANPEQRAAEIEASAVLPAATLRALVTHSADRLAADFDALPAEVWSHKVITAQGRTVLAVEIPWMRAREVAVHAVDLDAGAGFADLPNDLTAALVADAVAKQNTHGNLPGLAAWLTGRTAEAPSLGRWL